MSWIYAPVAPYVFIDRSIQFRRGSVGFTRLTLRAMFYFAACPMLVVYRRPWIKQSLATRLAHTDSSARIPEQT